MTGSQIHSGRDGERGNVLFLILIAVALFAALSYAVTQSSRSGGGDASSEKSLVSSAQVTQYPAGVRTSVVRMVIGSVTVDQLLFDTPSNFAAVVSAGKQKQGVFYPSTGDTPGGGATYQTAPAEVMAAGTPGTWVFSSKFQVKQIGSDSTSTNDSNEVIAFLPDVTKALCTKLDNQLGIALSSGDAPLGEIVAPVAADNMDLAHSGIGAVADASHTMGSTNAVFVGQPFACLKSSDSKYVYYHVLVER